MLTLVAIFLGYLLGSLPMGLIYVWLFTRQDVRTIGSGRTGGTNVMRAAGGRVAFSTGLSDGLKAACAIWVAQWLVPHSPWAEVLAGLAAILGHNYSIFIGFKGGAGGAPTVGAASALWVPALFIIAPLGGLIWYFIGYASVTTISFAVIATLIMAVRYALGASPVEYIYFGVFAFLLCVWALRPNLKRLMEGTERLHGYRAKKKASEQQAVNSEQ